MALPPAFLDELRLRTPLPGLIGRRVRLTKAGRQWKGCCPFHNEKSPSFYVYDEHFHCFGCGAHGDAFAFLMRAEGATFPEAVERLAAEAGMEVPKPSREARERERRARDLHFVLQAAEASFARRLRAPEGAEALAYLRNRGLTDGTITRFGLGWSGAGRGALLAELREEGIEARQLVEAGLMQEREEGRLTDLFFNRVMFPIRDRRGRTISFGGRILGDGQPKYVNGPETDLFSKRRNLYAMDMAREAAFRGAPLLVVEGYMDVIALHQAGFGGAVAPLGTALTAEQMAELWKVSAEPVLCFDGDAAGARAASKAAETALPLLEPEKSLRLATLPAGEDPDSLLRGGGAPAMQGVLDAALPLSEALFGLIAGHAMPEKPESRALIRTRLEEAARLIPHRALSSEYRRALMERFFAAGRRGAPKTAPRHPRPVPDDASVRDGRAAILLAICLNHPHLLPEVEEPLAMLDFPEGPLRAARDAVLAWLPAAERLDSAGLLAHLADSGAAKEVLRRPDLPPGARPGATPAEALEAFWQFFGFLRGERELVDDLQLAAAQLTETADAGAQTRLIRLASALDALRRGEADGT